MAVQVRTGAINNGTVNIGAAVELKGSTPVVVQLRCKNGTVPPSLKVDGNEVYFADSNVYSTQSKSGEVTLSGVLGDANNPLTYAVRSGYTGHVVTLKVFQASIAPRQQFLQVFIETPRAFRRDVRGLLGNWNGNATDDEEMILDRSVVTETAAGVELPSAYVEIYPALPSFVNLYRVTEASSLFSYESGESVSSFREDSFRGGNLRDYSQLEIDAAARACLMEKLERAVFSACLRDVLFSGDASLAKGYFLLQSKMGLTTLRANETIDIPPLVPSPSPSSSPSPTPGPFVEGSDLMVVLVVVGCVVGVLLIGAIGYWYRRARGRKLKYVMPEPVAETPMSRQVWVVG